MEEFYDEGSKAAVYAKDYTSKSYGNGCYFIRYDPYVYRGNKRS
jgi:hypothetical protein